MNEHESEPIRGLPAYLPAGEHIVWQGAPDWRQLARRAFHVRKVALYFVLLIGIHVGFRLAEGATLPGAVRGAAWLAVLGLSAIALLGLLAWLYGKTTVYTVTEQRLVMRFGVAIPMMINIPWQKIDAADLKVYAGGNGDIALTLARDQKLSYWLLWPHVRPWHFSPVRPMLRCLADAQPVAAHLGDVLGARRPAVDTSQPAAEPAAPAVARAGFAPAPHARNAAMS
jgi:hypothetical protein